MVNGAEPGPVYRSGGWDKSLPVVEEDIWDPHQIGGEADVLNSGVALWVPREVNICPVLKQTQRERSKSHRKSTRNTQVENDGREANWENLFFLHMQTKCICCCLFCRAGEHISHLLCSDSTMCVTA